MKTFLLLNVEVDLGLTLNSQKRKLFKLAFPLKIKRNNSELVLVDRFSVSHPIKFEDLDELELKSIDSDGFILFEFNYAKPTKPKKIFLAPQVEARVNGFTLFHSSVTKSKGHGPTKSVYEYYKRERDLSYYALITKEGVKTKKVLLGSLLKPGTRIRQMARIIDQHFDRGVPFDRKSLESILPSNLANRRIMKATLDVLLAEGFLAKPRETPETRNTRGRTSEKFVKTMMLRRFFVDPRSFLKPNGVNVG